MTAMIQLEGILPGLADPVADAQRVFRRILDAMARPGRVIELDSGVRPPVAGLEAASAIALTLLDYETSVMLPGGEEGSRLADWLRFHCGCPITAEPGAADFALLRADALPPLSDFNPGDPKYPDRSTTLVIACPALVDGVKLHLEGPGIPGSRTIAPQGLAEAFWTEVQANRSQFQLGIDIILTAGDAMIGLPRSTRITLEN